MAIIIEKHQNVCGNTIKVNHLLLMLALSLIFMLLTTVFCVNLGKKITSVKGDKRTKNIEIMVLINYLGNIWRTLEMSLLKCETDLVLTWSNKCVLSNHTKWTTFAITDTKFYAPVVSLPTQVM